MYCTSLEEYSSARASETWLRRRHIAIRFRRPREKIHAIYDGRRSRIARYVAKSRRPSRTDEIRPASKRAIVGSTDKETALAKAASYCMVCRVHTISLVLSTRLNSSAPLPRRITGDDNEISGNTMIETLALKQSAFRQSA